MSLLPGTELDRYTIEALLGEGAMGKVYRAFDTRLERAVAIKVLEPVDVGGDPRTPATGVDVGGDPRTPATGVDVGGDPRAPATGVDVGGDRPTPATGVDEPGAPLSARWAGSAAEAVASALREARAAAAILHPNATAIFDADRIGDTSFIVMELVPGTSLRRLIGDPTVPVGTRIRWLIDVAGALGAAHRAGVVHRDVKPENIIVRDDGLVKVLDFGIARLPRGDAQSFSTLTSSGGILGTPAYMAPEQIRGEEIDGRADQFGWGVLAYELLTGRLPWEGEDPIALLAAVLSAEPLPIPPEAGVPAEVAGAVLRALRKAPRERFSSMNDAAASITPHAGARRPARRPAGTSERSAGVASDGSPSSSVPSGHIAIELGLSDPGEATAAVASLDAPAFAERIAPRASSVLPAPSGDAPPAPIPVPPVAVTMGEAARGEVPGRPAAPVTIAETSDAPGQGAPAGEISGTQGDPQMRTLESGRGSGLPGQPRAPQGPGLRPPDFAAPVDVDEHLALLPAHATCKGIFFIDLLRFGATAMSPSELFHLAGFPERRYVGFRDYPAAEYLRLLVTVSLAVHPTLSLGEALRLIGQAAFGTASASLVGKTLFGVYGRDLEPLLFTAPRAYRLFLNFGEVSVEKTGPSTFRFGARDLPAFIETYQIGVIEGVLRHCNARGRLRLALPALDQATVELEIL